MSSADVFGGHTGGLDEAGTDIRKCAENFEGDYLRIYSIIDACIGSEWTSEAATVIAKKIEEQRPNLDALRDVINRYAAYCNRTSRRVEDTEEGIISGVNSNG